MSDFYNVQGQYLQNQALKLQMQYAPIQEEMKLQEGQMKLEQGRMQLDQQKLKLQALKNAPKFDDSVDPSSPSDDLYDNQIKNLQNMYKYNTYMANTMRLVDPDAAEKYANNARETMDSVTKVQDEKRKEQSHKYEEAARIAKAWDGSYEGWNDTIDELKNNNLIDKNKWMQLKSITDPEQRKKVRDKFLAEGTTVQQDNVKALQEAYLDLKNRKEVRMDAHTHFKELMEERKQANKEAADSAKHAQEDSKLGEKYKQYAIQNTQKYLAGLQRERGQIDNEIKNYLMFPTDDKEADKAAVESLNKRGSELDNEIHEQQKELKKLGADFAAPKPTKNSPPPSDNKNKQTITEQEAQQRLGERYKPGYNYWIENGHMFREPK